MRSATPSKMARRHRLTRHIVSARHGTTIIECMVASTLVIAGMMTLTTLVVRNGHLLRQLRYHQIAVDELQNQVDALYSVSAEQLEMHVAQLQVSEVCRDLLPDARLAGEVRSHDEAWQVILSLRWNEPGREENPIQMATWIYPEPSTIAGSAEDGLPTEQASP